MENIFANVDAAAEKYGHPKNYVMRRKHRRAS